MNHFGERVRCVRNVLARLAFAGGAAALCVAPAQAEDSAAPAAAAPAAAPRTVEIEAYDIEGNSLLDQLAIEEAVYPFLGPDRTKEDVEGARAALENAYRARGFQTVVVEIPPQTVKNGIVRLRVVEAAVGRLRVVGAQYYPPSELKNEVPSLQQGKVPDIPKVQAEIADTNRLPGRRVVPAVKAGKYPGTVDVDLKVTESNPLQASVELNNDHSQDTKALRATATVKYDNLWYAGHSASFTALLAPQDTSQAMVFAGSYLAPIWGTPWSILAFGYTSNSEVVTLGSTSVLGKGYAVGLRGLLQLPTVGDYSHSFSFGADFKHFLENLKFDDTTVGVTIDYVPLTASYSAQWMTDSSNLSATVSATLGLRGLGSDASVMNDKRAYARANFIRLNLDASETLALWHDIEVAGRFSGQLSDQALVSSEQFAAGGLSSVRGYLQSEAVGDNGAFESLELRSPSVGRYLTENIGEWRVFAFGDAAQTDIRDPLADQTSHAELVSVGVGTRISAFDMFSGEFVLGVPMKNGTVSKARKPYAQFSVKAGL